VLVNTGRRTIWCFLAYEPQPFDDSASCTASISKLVVHSTCVIWHALTWARAQLTAEMHVQV
jgi:hypothetical protein